jgi:hypothetical protein
MADQKISQLDSISAIDTSADLLPIVDSSGNETMKVTPDNLANGLNLGTNSTAQFAEVGIGTASPAERLHVARLDGTDNAFPTFSGISTILTTPGTATSGSGSGITIHSNVGGNSSVFFSDTDDADVGAILYSHSVDDLSFRVNGLTRATIDSDGDFAVDTNTLFVDASANSVGIGTSTPSAKLDISGSGNIRAEIESTNSGDVSLDLFRTGANSYRVVNDGGNFRIQHGSTPAGVETNDRFTILNTGFVGIGNSNPTQALDVTGNVTISGSLSKGSGSFKIDHPIKPETHHLVHSFIEGPQADNIYRGRVTLVAGGATVNLDMASHMTEGTFVALNGNIQCFTSNEDSWTPVRGSVSGNILTIEAQDPACTDEVSWMVIGERHDQHMIDASWTDENGKIIVEPLKLEVQSPEQGVNDLENP